MVVIWWMWLLLGVALLLLELLTPGGFYIFFFGVGAIVVGILTLLGLPGPPAAQWLLFGTISGVLLLLLRRPLQRRLNTRSSQEVDSLVGETALALEHIGVQQIGKAELRGSPWSAINIGESAIAAGQRCRVTGMNGLTLHIRG